MSYTTIKLPTDFIESLIDPIMNNTKNGFTSRAEVIKAAVREFTKKAEVSK